MPGIGLLPNDGPLFTFQTLFWVLAVSAFGLAYSVIAWARLREPGPGVRLLWLRAGLLFAALATVLLFALFLFVDSPASLVETVLVFASAALAGGLGCLFSLWVLKQAMGRSRSEAARSPHPFSLLGFWAGVVLGYTIAKWVIAAVFLVALTA